MIIKSVVQLAEAWIWLTIAFYLWKWIMQLLNMWLFSEYSSMFHPFVQMFWYDITFIFVYILCAVMVVMVGRWVMSWASNNWWQTPNNNWN